MFLQFRPHSGEKPFCGTGWQQQAEPELAVAGYGSYRTLVPISWTVAGGVEEFQAVDSKAGWLVKVVCDCIYGVGNKLIREV